MKRIFINATAAKTSGALTVLKDCVAYIESNPLEGNEYQIFTVIDELDKLENIQIHKIKPQNWLYPILWDNGNYSKFYFKSENIY
jgi:hypothetical protein